MSRKKLPIGVQTFAKIREADYYYVDKTRFALELIDSGSHYFLSRPRRFGKSLFLDTLAELFAANEPLFRGLYAHDRWDWSQPHPVIRISFAEGRLESREQLDRRIWDLLRLAQEQLDITCPQNLDIPGCFGELLRLAHQRSGRRVVVLVDEYDKPILDNLTQPEVARAMREGLRNLYSVIKDQDAHVRFAFLTGVSKFSKVSIFSGLNNLRDITLDRRYSALCGYTEADLDTVFAPELEGLDRAQIRAWYNGYNWTGEAVYNPFDVLLLFDAREYRPWWFETGTPTFLVDHLASRGTFLPGLERSFATDALLSAFDIERMETVALLFQTGYLTIAEQRYLGVQVRYRLDYPNREVRASLAEALLWRYHPDTGTVSEQSVRLYDLLEAADFPGLRALFEGLFASIPHDWYRRNPIAQYEGYYASVFYAYFAALGLDLRAEESSNAGRLDLAVRFPGQVYLFEFKVVELAGKGTALAQLQARGYAEAYRDMGQPIHLVGVEFSRAERTLVGFEVETLAPGDAG
jgi:hypothetical protein